MADPSPTPAPRAARKALRKFLAKNGISLAAASRSLGVTGPALVQWLGGRNVPSAPFRAAIETYTGGAVPAALWGLTRREARDAKRLSSVAAFVPEAA